MTVTWQDVQRRVGVTPDGVPGPQTLAAVARELGMTAAAQPAPMAWGAKVSPAFRARVREIAGALGCSPDDLMTCMAWETGRRFSPSVRNMAGSGATGLIQFMPQTARDLGTSVADLARMTAEKQLDYVEAYFRPWRGKLRNLGDLYMAILWPRAVGQPDSHVLWDRASRPTTYRQNMGLDVNRDGVITRGECLVKLVAMKAEGLRTENVG
jgi:hypothetical protein